MSISELIGSLEAHEKRLMMQEKEPFKSVFKTKIDIQSHKSKTSGETHGKYKKDERFFKKELYTSQVLQKEKSLRQELWLSC